VRTNYCSALVVNIIKVLTRLLFIKNGLKGKEMPCEDFKQCYNFKIRKKTFCEYFKCFFLLCFYITNLPPIYVGYSESNYRLRISLVHPRDCNFAHVQ